MNYRERVNAAAFDNFGGVNSDINAYDPDGYDPDYATGDTAATPSTTKVRAARPGQKMQVNITITNSTAAKLQIELFSAFKSITNYLKTEYVNGNYAFHPATSLEGIARIAAGTAGVVGFSENGNLVVQGAAVDPTLTVGCGEYPYVSFFESTKVLPFSCSYFRYTVTTDAQISNNIYSFESTFGGAEKSNVINPRAFFKPNQFQSKIVDIIAPFSIDGEKGLRLYVEAGETVTFALFIQRWGKVSI